MKKGLIWIIERYQKLPGPWRGKCRYTPTCSEYAKEAIQEYGIIKGSFMSLKRIIRCAPWGGSGYDPVPKRRIKE